jgi:hypothetical protein
VAYCQYTIHSAFVNGFWQDISTVDYFSQKSLLILPTDRQNCGNGVPTPPFPRKEAANGQENNREKPTQR